MTYQNDIANSGRAIETQPTWDGIDAESVARMRLQNRFRTGVDIARYTAGIMRADMAAYDGFYKKLIETIPLKNVTSRFAMERIKSETALPIVLQRERTVRKPPPEVERRDTAA